MTADAEVLIGLDGIVVEWNPAAEEMFGYPRSAAIGRELASMIIPHALRDRHREALERYRQTGEATILGLTLDLFAQRSDQSMFPVALTVDQVPDADPPLFRGRIRRRSAPTIR